MNRQEELYHHGILGQKWGVRRYQNSDGTLTDAGRRHYEKKQAKYEVKADKYKGHVVRSVMSTAATAGIGAGVATAIGFTAPMTLSVAAASGLVGVGATAVSKYRNIKMKRKSDKIEKILQEDNKLKTNAKVSANKYQNTDGSLTKAGRKKYGELIEARNDAIRNEAYANAYKKDGDKEGYKDFKELEKTSADKYSSLLNKQKDKAQVNQILENVPLPKDGSYRPWEEKNYKSKYT